MKRGHTPLSADVVDFLEEIHNLIFIGEKDIIVFVGLYRTIIISNNIDFLKWICSLC